MARRLPGLNIRADTSQVEEVLGFIDGMSSSFTSTRFTGAVLKYTHSTLSKEFDVYMSGIAKTNPERYKHVYEWGQVGVRKWQLWEHRLKGHGATRAAEWVWKPSIFPIPSPAQRARNPNDPMSAVPASIVKKLTKPYYFTWKAPIMEYDTPVTIRPKHAKQLFIPTFDSPRGYIFTDIAYNPKPGGDKTTGSFTAAWVNYWTTIAPKSFEAEVQRTVEKRLGLEAREKIRKTRRARPKTVGLLTAANTTIAFNKGRQQAQAIMDKLAGEFDREEDYDIEW